MLAGLTATILAVGAAAPPSKEPIRLEFKEKSWKEVLAAVAKPLGLSLQIDFDPPGTFTYSDPTPMTPDKALEIVHATLLDRGITLIRKDKLLLAIRLAENIDKPLTEFAPMEEIVQRRDNLPVFTVVKLNSLNATQVKTELGGLLSPRGKIAETGIANRVAVWDRCDCVREFIKVLGTIDAPGRNATVPLRTYQLKHARAFEAVQVLSKILVVPPPQQGPQMPPGMPIRPPDFGQMGEALGQKKVIQAFMPGVNINSAIPGQSISSSSAVGQTEIEFDETRNIVFVRADRDKLAIADRVIASLDRPGFSEEGGAPGDKIEIRTYRLTENNGHKVAEALRETFSGTPGFYVEGAENRLFVRGPLRRMAEIEALLAKLAPDRPEFAVLPVPPGAAKELSRQLMSLFKNEPEASRPTIVADGSGDRIIVRGSPRQVTLIRGFARDVMPPGVVDSEPARKPTTKN